MRISLCVLYAISIIAALAIIYLLTSAQNMGTLLR